MTFRPSLRSEICGVTPAEYELTHYGEIARLTWQPCLNDCDVDIEIERPASTPPGHKTPRPPYHLAQQHWARFDPDPMSQHLFTSPDTPWHILIATTALPPTSSHNHTLTADPASRPRRPPRRVASPPGPAIKPQHQKPPKTHAPPPKPPASLGVLNPGSRAGPRSEVLEPRLKVREHDWTGRRERDRWGRLR